MKRLTYTLSLNRWLSVGAAVVCLTVAPIAFAADHVAANSSQTAKGLLKNGGIEQGERAPSDWKQGKAIPGVQYEWDRREGHNSKASLCLHKTENRYFPFAQWHQTLLNSGDTSKLKVRVWVKAEKATKGIVDVLFANKSGKSGHQWVAYIGAKNAGDPPASHDWKEYSGVVEIPAGTTHIAIAPQIYGPGKLWFDDIQAEFVPNKTPKTDAVTGKPAR